MRLVPETLARALEQDLSPAWLVAGDEPLLVGEAADAIRSRARALGYTGRDVLFVERGFDWDVLQGELRSLSLFAERRIIELRMPQAKPGAEGSRVLVAALADCSADALLLLITDKIEWADRSSAWVKAFETHGSCVDAEQLLPEQLPAWIGARMRRAGLVPDDDAVELLAERCEGNLVAAHQQIERLALLAGPGAVTVETVADSVAMSARYHVFQLSEALLAGEAARVLRIIDGLAAEGEEPTLVLWCIAEELRSILQWSAQPRGAARRLLRGGRRRQELLRSAHARVPRERAWELLGAAARIDALIKGPRKDEAWSALARVATELCIAAGIRAS
ncbi:MAG TPA: DNA polymerase III subunit delta [Steroidobacteraceae bacterium]|nr:DNA polymerase III subunit delta [Steroidobacteraceae bacterium]